MTVDEPFTTYSLEGVRKANTDALWALVEKARRQLEANDRYSALALAGSLAMGRADPFSDIDLHCVVSRQGGMPREHEWRDIAGELDPLVLARQIPGICGGFCLTEEWVHLDVIVHDEEASRGALTDGIRWLFDRRPEGGIRPKEPLATAEDGTPWFPIDKVEWFFYMLGNFVVVIGRRELVLGLNAVTVLRDDCLVPLLLASRGVTRTGGNKRLNPFLTSREIGILSGLPPAVPTVDGLIAAEFAIAREFIHRGRQLAEVAGAEWPVELERATIQHVEWMLGASIGL